MVPDPLVWDSLGGSLLAASGKCKAEPPVLTLAPSPTSAMSLPLLQCPPPSTGSRNSTTLVGTTWRRHGGRQVVRVKVWDSHMA